MSTGKGPITQRMVALTFAVLLVAGCATTAGGKQGQPAAAAADSYHPTSAHPADPWEPFNRTMFALNEALDKAVVRPAAEVYDAVMPELLRKGLRNVFSNVGNVAIGLNNFLQGKVGEAFSDWMRFGFNTTFGIFGLFDIASEAGLPKHDEDFGQTLARWGVADGPYLVLPLMGPKTLRDALATALPVDRGLNPAEQLDDARDRWAVRVVRSLDARARVLSADAALDEVADKYAFVREAYLQRRAYQIHDGNPPRQYETFE